MLKGEWVILQSLSTSVGSKGIMKKKPIFFTDIDGTLLDLYGEEGSAGILRRMFNDTFPLAAIGPPCHYRFEEAYGITRGTMIEVFDELWNIPIPPYDGAVTFVKDLQRRGFRVLGVTLRPSEDSKIASYRDTPIFGLDGLYMVDSTAEKAPLITKLSEGAECFYLDDKIETAIEVSVKCLNARVMLINRPWNSSLDLCMEYDRVFTLNAAADGAQYLHDRHEKRDGFGDVTPLPQRGNKGNG